MRLFGWLFAACLILPPILAQAQTVQGIPSLGSAGAAATGDLVPTSQGGSAASTKQSWSAVSTLFDTLSHNFSGSNNFSGNNTSSGSNSATPSSVECPSGAGTLTPAHNNIVCTLSGNVTLAVPSSFVAGTPYKITFTENGTGGYSVSLPTSGYAVNSSAFLANAPNLNISTAANTTSVVYLDPENIGSNQVMVTGLSPGITPYAPPSLVASLSTTATNTGSGGAASGTSSSTLAMASGDTLVVFDTGYGNTGATAAKPNMTAPTIASGTLGTCALLSGTRYSGTSTSWQGTEGWACPISAGATAAVTAHWTGTLCYFCAFVAMDIHGLNASTPDAGLGAVADATGTAVSVTTNGGGVAGKYYFYVASLPVNQTISTPPAGWTNIVPEGSLGWAVYYQVAAAGTGVTATATLSASTGWGASIWAGTP